MHEYLNLSLEVKVSSLKAAGNSVFRMEVSPYMKGNKLTSLIPTKEPTAIDLRPS